MVNAIFVTVRTGSTRLPRKALLPIFKDIGSLEYLLQRVKPADNGPLVVVCTTTLSEDNAIVEIAARYGAQVFRGSVEDKLLRWRDACRAFNVERFVTADGDDLFCDPNLLAKGLDMLRAEDLDFISAPQAPCGGFSYGISTRALEEVCQVKTSDQTEMMWVYFTETGLFKLGELEIDSNMARPEYRLTLDYPEDLDFFKQVIGYFGGDPKVPLTQIVSYLDSNPEVRAINAWRQADFLLNQSRKIRLEITNGLE